MIESSNDIYDVASIKKYTFTSESIPRLSVNDPEVLRRMKSSVSFKHYLKCQYFMLKYALVKEMFGYLVLFNCSLIIMFLKFIFFLSFILSLFILLIGKC